MSSSSTRKAERHLLSSLDLSSDDVRGLIARARELKAGATPAFAGRIAALLFFNPSLRTRLSCEAALGKFGGNAVAFAPGTDTWSFEHNDGTIMDGSKQEHVRELAPVLSRMADVIGVRRSELVTTASGSGGVTESYADLAQDSFLHALAEHAQVPVINLESNRWHPLQGLADGQTLVEKLADPKDQKYVLTWAWHPKALPVATPHSQLMAAVDLGMDVTVLRPPGYGLDPEVMKVGAERASEAGGRLRESESSTEALDGARVVCAKSWSALSAYGRFEEESRAKQALRDEWRLTADKMGRTDDAWLMHCLPVRRGVVVDDAVLDGKRSAVVDEAENRLWTAAAVFEWAFGG